MPGDGVSCGRREGLGDRSHWRTKLRIETGVRPRKEVMTEEMGQGVPNALCCAWRGGWFYLCHHRPCGFASQGFSAVAFLSPNGDGLFFCVV